MQATTSRDIAQDATELTDVDGLGTIVQGYRNYNFADADLRHLELDRFREVLSRRYQGRGGHVVTLFDGCHILNWAPENTVELDTAAFLDEGESNVPSNLLGGEPVFEAQVESHEISQSSSIDSVLAIMNNQGFSNVVKNIQDLCQLVEDDDEPPVSLEAVKNLAIFLLQEARDKPEAHIGYYSDGLLSADWDVHEGLLSLIFLKDQSIRLVITSTPSPIKDIPDVDKRRGEITMHRDRIGCVFNCMFETLMVV